MLGWLFWVRTTLISMVVVGALIWAFVWRNPTLVIPWLSMLAKVPIAFVAYGLVICVGVLSPRQIKVHRGGITYNAASNTIHIEWGRIESAEVMIDETGQSWLHFAVALRRGGRRKRSFAVSPKVSIDSLQILLERGMELRALERPTPLARIKQ
jgi:hypothetical protein